MKDKERRVLEIKGYINDDASLEMFVNGEHTIQYFEDRSRAIIALSFIRADYIEEGYHEEVYDLSREEGRFVELEMIKHVEVLKAIEEERIKEEKKMPFLKWLARLVAHIK